MQLVVKTYRIARPSCSRQIRTADRISGDRIGSPTRSVERAAVLLRRGGPQGAGKRNSWLDRAELQQLVVMATHQLVNQRRISFEVVPAMETPNEETRRALVAAEAKELGLIPDDSAYFNDIDELMAFLDE